MNVTYEISGNMSNYIPPRTLGEGGGYSHVPRSIRLCQHRSGYGSVKTEAKKFIFEFRQRPHPPQS